MTTTKPFDVVIFGATGYTGQLIVEYFLCETETAIGHSNALKWAIAGRSVIKIESIKATLKAKLEARGLDPTVVDKVPVLLADGNDREQLLALVNATRASCSRSPHGVHYCDLSGEMTWVKHNVEQWEATAQATGARIVHCCGYEAVPSDLMAFLLADFATEKLGTKLSRVNHFWTDARGAASGGTCISLLTMLDSASSSELQAMMTPFYCTSPAYAQAKQSLVPANTSTLWIPYDRDLKARSALFVGAAINQLVVLRSNYLFKDKYGAKFSYVERWGLGSVGNWIFALLTTLVGGLAVFSWTRKLLWKLVPNAGEGPTQATLDNGYFKAKAFAYDEHGALVAIGDSSCAGDPGYIATSKMISEVAFCLANDERDGALASGGILTPSTACGRSLVKRLNDKHIVHFTVTKAVD